MDWTKLTRKQLRRIIRSEKRKILKESQDASKLQSIVDAINSGAATASMGMGMGPDEILIRFGNGPGQALVLKVRGF